MSASPARRRLCGRISGALVVLLAVAASAAAQDEGEDATAGPVRLGPPVLLRPGDAPAAESALVTPVPGRIGRRAPQGTKGIEVNPLDEIDPEAIGILDESNGGFPGDMWRGSSRGSIERLLPRLPGAMDSAVMRSLARRLLLTNATPPRRRAGARSNGDANLLALRVDRLVALGDIDGMNNLLRMVPQRHDDEVLGRARVEGHLLSGDAPGACRKVRSEAPTHHDKTYWRKAMVFCQIHAGEMDQAMLGVGLMREQGMSEDSAFFSLVDAFAGAELRQVAVASPLHFALLGAAGEPYPSKAIDEASPGVLVALARSGDVDLTLRARAGERAVAAGVLRPDLLGEIYETFAFKAEELSSPISTAREDEGPRGRALLYQLARREDLPAARAELLRAALVNAQRADLYQMAVRVFLPMLLRVPAEPTLVWFAETAGRALYAAGRYQRGGAWLTLARQEAILNPQAAAAVTVLWPYSRLAGSPPLAWEGNLAAWRAARSKEGSAIERQRQALLRGAFMALGESDSLTWIDLATETGTLGEPIPDAALLYALRDASEMRRIGETVLLTLLVLGEEGPAECHPMALNAVLSALVQIGLASEARALAIEAAIARGV